MPGSVTTSHSRSDMSDLDPDSIITIRWSALGNPPVNLELLSYAHAEDLAGDLMTQSVLYGAPWRVRLEGPRIFMTVDTVRCRAFHNFAKQLVDHYGCDYAAVLVSASKSPR